MQEAVPHGGAMMAILGLDENKIKEMENYLEDLLK